MQFQILAIFAVVAAASAQEYGRPKEIRIIKQSHEQDPAGFYKFSYETENGINVVEEGTVIRPGTNDESSAKQGSYSYPGPDGQFYSLSYIADDDGFRANGLHLPTPPPIPEEILRALQQAAKEDAQYDDRGFLKKKK